MDIKLLIQPFFENAAALLSGPHLVAATIARLVLAVLREVGFDPGKAAKKLAKLGFEISSALLSDLVKAAKTGIRGMTAWFEDKLATSPEVNGATTQVLVDQAEPVATALQEALPDEKDQVAEAMQEGLQAYGGATAEIAALYADVLKDITKFAVLVGEMQQKTEAWASQSVEAQEDSLIRNIRQTYSGDRPIDQRVRAGKRSIVTDVVQDQRTSGAGGSQVISAGSKDD